MNRQCFYITSLQSGLVLDVEKDGIMAGTNVILYSKKAGKHFNQLFYADPYTLTIRTALNNMCLDTRGK